MSWQDRLPPREAALYRRCDEVLHYVWDPIGVAGIPEARDEYYDYLPQVFELVRDEATEQVIHDHLRHTELLRMGLMGAQDARTAAVEALQAWRRWTWENISEEGTRV